MTMNLVHLAQEISHERETELNRELEHTRVAAELEHSSRTALARRQVARRIRRGYLVTLRHITQPPALAP